MALMATSIILLHFGCVYKKFLKNPDLYDLDIKTEGLSRQKNKEYWDTIPDNTFFYNIDLSSAYWQIAFRLGYLDKRMFDRYMLDDQYKKVKR